MERYYFFKRQKRLGPFSVEQLKSLIANRTISSQTLIFTDSGEKKRAELLLEPFSEKSPSDAKSADECLVDISSSSDSAEMYRWENPLVLNSNTHSYDEIRSRLTDGSENAKKVESVYCTHCGNQVKNNAVICPSCGFAPSIGGQFCQKCGSSFEQGQQICLKCGASLEDVEFAPRKKKISDIDIGCLVVIIVIVLAIIVVMSMMAGIITQLRE